MSTEQAQEKAGVSIQHVEGRVVFQIGDQTPAVMTPNEARKGIHLIAMAAEEAAKYNRRATQQERERIARERHEARQAEREEQRERARARHISELRGEV